MGKLFIVPTPIGNLEDITFRAIRMLKEADIILAEDTRKTGILLKHYDIGTKLISHHKFNEHKTVSTITGWINEGKTICLVSDAGTPGISDPGFLLVRTCLENGITVETLPGATALIPALVNSGFPCDRFCFEGFLPVKKGRQKKLCSISEEERTMIFYESPYRLLKTLRDFAQYFGAEREVSVSREISKIYEETVRGSIEMVIEYFTSKEPKGEFVIVLSGKNPKPNSPEE
ncbi:MAG: 16S rRNA (cytidine(1402)-2'-O)-methyltransferase [Rikenellaceae bacterium]|nr:16S rRNA (cytidine(1402)-2'-O)-methyltransferase [Rikenellaceae bacterium]